MAQYLQIHSHALTSSGACEPTQGAPIALAADKILLCSVRFCGEERPKLKGVNKILQSPHRITPHQ